VEETVVEVMVAVELAAVGSEVEEMVPEEMVMVAKVAAMLEVENSAVVD
jgi:hypothetical protein